MSTSFDKGPTTVIVGWFDGCPFKVTINSTGDGKSKGHPRTGHEGPEVKWRYNAPLSLTSALDGGVNTTPRPLYPWERPGTHYIVGWVSTRAGLDGWEKTRFHRVSIPELPSF